MRQLIENTPIPLAGLALGVISLGGLLKSLSPAVYWLGVCVACAAIALLITRAVIFPRSVRQDFENPVFASVSGTFFMTIMQISVALALFAPRAAFVLWSAAVAGHLALIGWFSLAFVRRFRWEDVAPTYFIAYVGIIVASVTSPTFGMQAIGQILFWFGFALYAILLVVVTYRMVTRPLPVGARPLVCIYAAPMSLSLTGYLSVYSQPSLVMTGILAALAQILLVVVLLQLPGLFEMLHNRFFPSIAAMTFPFVITATGLGKAAAVIAAGNAFAGAALAPTMRALATGETVLAVFMVVYAFVRYCVYFAGIFAPEMEAAASEA